MTSGTVGSWERPVLESWSSLCSLCDLRPLPESQAPHITLELSITHICMHQTGLDQFVHGSHPAPSLTLVLPGVYRVGMRSCLTLLRLWPKHGYQLELKVILKVEFHPLSQLMGKSLLAWCCRCLGACAVLVQNAPPPGRDPQPNPWVYSSEGC